MQTKVDPCDWESIRSDIVCLNYELQAAKNFVQDLTGGSYDPGTWVSTYPVEDDPADNADDIEDSQLPGLEETQAVADIEDSQLPGLEEAETAADICFFHPPPVSAPPASEAPQVVAGIDDDSNNQRHLLHQRRLRLLLTS